MNTRITVLLTIVLLAACTKVEVKESLPEINNIEANGMDSDLPRMELTVDPDLLAKMFIHFSSKIEAPVLVDYYNAQGQEVFSQKKGVLEIRGSSTSAYPMKSLGILFNQAIDNTTGEILDPAIAMQGDDLTQIRNIRLRNSGNDYGITMLKDYAYSEFARINQLDLELKYSTPVQVFVNKTYYGLLNLRTENDVVALSNLLNVDSTAITYMKVDVKNENLEFRKGNEAYAESFRKAIRSKDTEALKRFVDVDNFIDYILFQDYIGNNDWPGNNVSLYSVNQGPFRFFLYDLDYAAYSTKNQRLPELEFLSADVAKIFQAFYNVDEEFTLKLESRKRELYQKFSPEQFSTIVDALALKIENEIPYLIAKRGSPTSTLHWRLALETLKRDFERTDYYNRKHYKL